METVYNLQNEKKKIDQAQSWASGYRTKFGLFGTTEWFRNIKTNNLIQIIEGEISRKYKAGHNDFDMFSISDGILTYDFELLGPDKFYVVGKRIRIEAIKNEFIHPTSGLEKLLIPLKIEIETSFSFN